MALTPAAAPLGDDMVYPECEKSCPKGCDSPKDEHKVECLPCKKCHEAADKVASLNGAADMKVPGMNGADMTGMTGTNIPAGMDNGAVTGDVAGTMPAGMDNGAVTGDVAGSTPGSGNDGSSPGSGNDGSSPGSGSDGSSPGS